MSLALSIIVPGRMPYERQAEAVTLPGVMGQFTVLPSHGAMLAQVEPGLVEIKVSGQVEKLVIGRGICEVGADQVRVLAGKSALPGDFDTAAAKEALEAAEAQLAQQAGPVAEGWTEAQEEVAWADALSRLVAGS
ncbi:MAG: ATP synthase F1 subunit epsilon [Myxococcota bacterium]|jgi:F-type H+-transporting ATPase subunit epsilon|nr:ATP synthase F1 subunit epsilon [Myxococcales bacterium]MBF95365.1 ATP synthase F1 subunit epsilon [Myxococcales bacterium]MEC7751254.1 ATP synthase F1 subunit epsilon [Myxococcota bacterium]|tara:strand:- start:101 stop:505 length:405 start_codon:yes stop_codon:yes gene_type:complete